MLALAAWLCLAAAPVLPAVAAARAGDNASVLCIAPDGVLHASGIAGTCQPGQTAVPLATSATGACDSNPWQGADDCDTSTPTGGDDLTALEYRVKALENHPVFEVVDRDKRPILQVTPGKVVLINAAGDRVIELRAIERGGHLLARNLAGDEVALAVSGDVGGLVLTEGGVKRVEYGKQPAGNVSLRFPKGSGVVAAIGESQGISGAIVVGDASGQARALMSLIDNKASLSIQNAKGAPVVALTEGATQGGLLVIGDATSEPMVKFGVNEDRYGIVLAGPVSGFPLVPNSGLPGSYFLGCAGGDKCGPGGGGSQ